MLEATQKDQKLVFKTNYCLMQVKSIAECSKGSILQYFQPSFSYHLPFSPLFCLFITGFNLDGIHEKKNLDGIHEKICNKFISSSLTYYIETPKTLFQARKIYISTC